MPLNLEPKLLEPLVAQLKDTITQRLPNERTFGFEYEFIAREPITEEMFNGLNAFIAGQGYSQSPRGYECPSGLFFVFEPGGQIEFGSPPLSGKDRATLASLLNEIETIKKQIEQALGMAYLATGYLPNRSRSPLLLKLPRYIAMQKHLSQKGRRGLEMMKGTASIHLHVSLNSMAELPDLFRQVCELARTEAFQMSPVRRDIWNNTDPSRSGSTPCLVAAKEPEAWLRAYVTSVLNADHLETGCPFWQTPEITFEMFLNHMSTMFWDVRLNLKGPTIEMRTLDSVPPAEFITQWENFTQQLSK